VTPARTNAGLLSGFGSGMALAVCAVTLAVIVARTLEAVL